MTRRVDYLIEDIRKHTENEDFSDTIGIQDSEFLRFINDAQYRIHSLIVQQHSQVLLEEAEQTITADQESYSLPFKTYLGNKLASVEYSPTGQSDDYYALRKVALRQRSPASNGDPIYYIQKSGNVLIYPIPQNSTGKLRFNYVKSIPRLDTRRASVNAVTLDSNTNTISSLTLETSTDTIDDTTLDKFTRFTVVDAEGNIQMKNVRFDSINTTTGVVTINSGFTYETGETISAGDYIVAGEYSTTHSILDQMVERYIIAYCTAAILHRDSSADLTAQSRLLANMEQEIVASYADISDDLMEIPEIISDDDAWSW